MKKNGIQQVILFLAATLAGVGVHFLYHFAPVWPIALLAPVRESLWEHVKLLLWPSLAAAGYLRVRYGQPLQPRLAATLVSCAILLALSYGYHILLGGEEAAVDIGLYVVLMAACFLLPRWLHGIPEWVWQATIPLTILLVGLVVLFTFLPPPGLLFTDLGGANTWSRIIC